MVGLALAGCQSEATRSLEGVEAWLARIKDFYHRHQRWPERLEDLQECFDTQEDFQRALLNPVTQEDPGYEYVKPPEWLQGTPLSKRVVILYQLRASGRAEDLPVGYMDGQARLLQPDAITQTVPNWQPFRPPEAPVEVAFPSPPFRDTTPTPGSPQLDAPAKTPSTPTEAPPSKPSALLGTKPSSDLRESVLWSYRANFCGLQYMLFGMRSALFYRAAQENPYQLLDQLSASLTKQQAQIRHRQQLQIQNYPALDVELGLAAEQHQFRVRWCLAGDRLYCLCVVGPDGTVNEATAGKFFQSFRLLP
ncbi:MAG: hypothetical protein NZ602_01940 [Thermoguttaceae bacterium]|nr:hypothetical protein [Thermoguttaceae bacterium]